MTFRVLVIGGRVPLPFARLRDALDVLLANRLPDVEILTAGGPGVPALAESYARARNLDVVAVPPDHVCHRAAALEKQAEALVVLADAVVVVWDAASGQNYELMNAATAKGIPAQVLGVVERRGKPVEPPAPPDRGACRTEGDRSAVGLEPAENVVEPARVDGQHGAVHLLSREAESG
jgi:hypothetical protein